MPAKPKLPRNAKRLPKGTTKDDYDPEVYLAWKRDRGRQRQERYRRRARHRGIRDVTFQLGKDAREILDRSRKELGMSRSQFITTLLEALNGK